MSLDWTFELTTELSKELLGTLVAPEDVMLDAAILDRVELLIALALLKAGVSDPPDPPPQALNMAHVSVK